MTEQVRSANVAQNERNNFIPFSQEEAYIAAIKAVAERIVDHFPQDFVHVADASGTGNEVKAIKQIASERGLRGKIFGVDPDDFAIDYARETIPSGDGVEIEFIKGYGQDLPKLLHGKIPENGVHSVSMFDAIHEVRGKEEKLRVLRAEKEITMPLGLNVKTSAFTSEGMGEDAAQYGFWIGRAIWALGGRGKKESEKSTDGSELTEDLKPEEYVGLLREAGFKYPAMHMRIVHLPNSALVAISHYPRFADGAIEKFEPRTPEVKIPEVFEMSDSLANIAIARNIGPLERRWYEYFAYKPLKSAA